MSGVQSGGSVLRKRNSEIDALKAFLICGVVLGHLIAAILPEWRSAVGLLVRQASLTHYFMPLFVAVAGYYFASTVQKYSSFAVIVNKAAELLLPVCIWYGGYAILKEYDQLSVKSLIWVLCNGIYGQLWFLVSTFVSLVLIVLLRCLARGNSSLFIVLACLLGIALHFVHVPGIYFLKWNYHVPYLFPFAVLGYLFGLQKSCWPLVNVKCRAICVAVYVVLCWYVPENMSHWKTGTCLFSGAYSWQEIAWCSVYRDVIAALGIVSMVPLLRYIWKFLNRNAFIVRVTVLVGQNTLAIYVLQSFVVERWIHGMSLYKCAFVQEHSSLIYWMVIPIGALMITVSLTYVCVWLKRIPYIGKLLFGCKVISVQKTP